MRGWRTEGAPPLTVVLSPNLDYQPKFATEVLLWADKETFGGIRLMTVLTEARDKVSAAVMELQPFL